MNTPPKIKRFDPPQFTMADMDLKGHRFGLHNPDYALQFAKIASGFVHLEQAMASVLAFLSGMESAGTARYLWNAIISPKARIGALEHLLEKAPANADLGPEYDAIIREFKAINAARNDYVHGFWYTSIADGSVKLARPSQDPHGLNTLVAKPEPLYALESLAGRIGSLDFDLTAKIALAMAEKQRVRRAQRASAGQPRRKPSQSRAQRAKPSPE